VITAATIVALVYVVNVTKILLMWINCLLLIDPSQPYALTLTNHSTSSLTVQWKHDGRADEYVLSVNGTHLSIPAPTTSAVIPVSTPGAQYHVAVMAVKGVLNSSPYDSWFTAGEHSLLNDSSSRALYKTFTNLV
jgi:Fibronectin type III domain